MAYPRWMKKKAHKKTKGKKANTKTNRKVDVRVKLKIQQPASLTASLIPGNQPYLWYAYGAVNSDYLSVQSNAEHRLHATLYDEYCIKKVSVKFLPSFNAVQVPLNESTSPNQVLYSFIDWDGKVPVATSLDVPTKIQAYDSCRRTNIYRPVTRSFSPKKSRWLDSGTTYQNTEALRMDGLLAVIGFYAENQLIAGGNIGSFEITWEMAYRGKKPTSFAATDDGLGIVVRNLEQGDIIPPTNDPTALTGYDVPYVPE